VRFVRLHAQRFGPLRDRELAFGSDALVVFGPNESGKSSLRAALETIVYGFEPATRDKHPLYLWDGGAGGDLHVEAELLLDSGETQRVERVLQATGKLRTAPGREDFAGKREGNRPLPWASLSREVFQAVYSLELEELVALDRNVQGQLDDLLLPESPGVELLSAARVRGALREEMQRLWRGDRLGRPLSRALREKLAQARARAVEAGAAESDLRETHDELARLETELAELGGRKQALAALARIAELEEERRGPAQRLAREELALAPAEAWLLERAAEIEAHAARAGRDAAALERAAELEARARAQRADEEHELARVLEGPQGAPHREAARRADLDGLRRAQEEWARGFEAHARVPAQGPLPAAPLAALAVGAVALAAGLLLGIQSLSAAGALLFAAAIALLLVQGHREQPAAPQPAPEYVRRAVTALGARAELLASPTSLLRLVEGLERALRRGDEAAGDERDAARLREAAGAHEREDRALASELGVGAEGEPEARATRLRAALDAARAREREVLGDRSERAPAQAQLAAIDGRLARLREELRRDPDAARFAADPAQSAGGDPAARLRECDAATLRTSGRAGELRQRLAADPGSRRAAAQDEIAALEAELAEAMRQHDRLALLESIVAHAEAGWRDAHQPDVLRRAGDYLRRITDGRYTRLDVDAASRVLAVTPAGGEPRPVAPPLSSGTRDQIFLCLLLGLLDHLDEDRERLPLILDDALLRTDGLRRPEVWELLAHAARRRQIFVLTCQEAIAREAEEALKVPRIDLSA
jgi:uncharacterized protein YhaN